jgi:hypothetical protein
MIEGKKNMAKENEKKFTIKMKLFTLTIWITIAGVVLIIIGTILLNSFPNEFFKKYFALKPIFDMVVTLGSTLLSAGLVSILVEISTIKGIVSAALKDALDGKFPLEAYSNQVLSKINKRIAAKRGSVGVEKIDDSIYSLEPKLIELVDGLYYNSYNAIYEITPDENNKIFKKNVTLDYEIINEYEKNNYILYRISLYNVSNNMTDEEKKEKFKINSFIINQTDLTSEVENYKTIIPVKEKYSEYQYYVEFKRELQKCKKHKVHIEFEYEVSINDLSQIFRLTHPCKSMVHEIYINNENKNNKNNWEIHGAAFVSFYCKENNNNGFHVKQKHSSDIEIQFNNWCIPGAGYVVYLNQK